MVDKKKAKDASTSEEIKPEEEEKFECVFINDNGVAKLEKVKTGIQDDTNIEIVSGLAEGVEIITGPYNMVSKILKPGDKVEKKGGAAKKEESTEE